MKIVIVSTDREFEVRVIDDQGLTIRKFIYLSAEQARRAALRGQQHTAIVR
jgi:hypothetical protein